MEEDIKILEEFIEVCEYQYFNGSEVFRSELYKPVKNLLIKYKEQEKLLNILKNRVGNVSYKSERIIKIKEDDLPLLEKLLEKEGIKDE